MTGSYPGRRAANKHRRQVRPRYGRLAALGASLTVTLVAVLGGSGLLPSAERAAADLPTPPTTSPSAAPSAVRDRAHQRPDRRAARVVDPGAVTALPTDSGTGRRIVFSESRQRVWLVSRGHQVQRTYLVSGSLTDNLHPGTYHVFSRSRVAWGIDDSGTMHYFVRFTEGQNAAIGFHDIPVKDGKPLQTVAQLGTPQSHGCIRQRRSDAIALWGFAPIGTEVVVTA